MNFRNDQLQIVLNYDTHGRNCLKFEERCSIHKAISHKMNYDSEMVLETTISRKVKNILTEIADLKYDFKILHYFEDKTTGLKTLREW
ncbi:MAG: hypothetical protein WCY77_10115 [Weeksellaceae bacterium]